MAAQRIVVIGASSGGIEALRQVAAGLPEGFPAPVCVVVHSSPQSPGVLADILNRPGQLRATQVQQEERLHPSRIYVAPPDYHLLVEPGKLRISRGPRENRFRPAIDPLFRSAAQVFGPSAIGVILTGNLDDGTAGLYTIKQLGGVTIVQDPQEALFPSMPRSATQHVRPDYCVPLNEIASVLVSVAATPAYERGEAIVPDHIDLEVKVAKEQSAMEAGIEHFGEPSPYACPECHGVLRQLKEGGRFRFRCHTGHAYSPDSLLAAVGEGIEEALWTAIRALDEGSLLLKHLSGHLEESDSSRAEHFAVRSLEARRQADVVRQVVTEREEVAAEER